MMKTEKTSIPFEKLADWVDGRLSQKEAAAITVQMETADGQTVEDLAWLRSFQQINQDIVLAVPTDEVRQQLAAQFKKYANAHRPPSLLQRLTAMLTFDSNSRPALVGVRSAGQGQSRQLVYSLDQADVALNIQSHQSDSQFDVIGQLFPNDEADVLSVVEPYSVQLFQIDDENNEIALTVTDDLGEFAFTAVDGGTYLITLSGSAYETTLSPIELHA